MKDGKKWHTTSLLDFFPPRSSYSDNLPPISYVKYGDVETNKSINKINFKKNDLLHASENLFAGKMNCPGKTRSAI